MLVSTETFGIVWGIFAVAVIIYLACLQSLFSYMKAFHPDEWAKLGSPSLFWNNSLKNNWLFFSFFFRRDYRRLADVRLDQRFQVIWGLFLLNLVLFVILFILFGMKR